MFTPISDRLNALLDTNLRYQLYLLFKPITERFRSYMHSSAGLVITATAGKKVPKTGASICHYQAKGKMGQIPAGTDMPALIGTVVNATYNIFVFTIDSAGTKSTYMGTAAATEANVKWPKLNPEHAIIGYVKIHVTGTGDFVGNTTALDDGTVFSSAAADVLYVSLVGMSFPGAVVD